MDRIQFQIQGSEPEPYTVTFHRTDSQLIGVCTCAAGQKGQHCKHRLGILLGDTSICSSQPTHLVQHVQAWLPGTPVAQALQSIRAAEADLARAKAQLAQAKKQLSTALYGRTA